jgi:hypothetical protein
MYCIQCHNSQSKCINSTVKLRRPSRICPGTLEEILILQLSNLFPETIDCGFEFRLSVLSHRKIYYQGET